MPRLPPALRSCIQKGCLLCAELCISALLFCKEGVHRVVGGGGGGRAINYIRPIPTSTGKENSVRSTGIIKKYSNFIGFPIFLNSTVVNTVEALWRKNPSSVTQEEHEEFFKYMSNGYEKPQYRSAVMSGDGLLAWSANRVPCPVLYIPYQTPKPHSHGVGCGRLGARGQSAATGGWARVGGVDKVVTDVVGCAPCFPADMILLHVCMVRG